MLPKWMKWQVFRPRERLTRHISCRFVGRPPPPDSKMIQASQVLHNSNASLSCLITVFYWGVVWPTLPDEARYSGWWDKIAGNLLLLLSLR